VLKVANIWVKADQLLMAMRCPMQATLLGRFLPRGYRTQPRVSTFIGAKIIVRRFDR